MNEHASVSDWDAIVREMLTKPELRAAFHEICGHETTSTQGFQEFFDYAGAYIGAGCVDTACVILEDLDTIDAGAVAGCAPDRVLAVTSVLKTIAAEHLWQGILIGILMMAKKSK